LDRTMGRRLDVFAEVLEIERERLRSWGIVKTVLSAWWSIEDEGSGREDAIALAGLLASPGM
jgi:streptomycin 6-kinase